MTTIESLLHTTGFLSTEFSYENALEDTFRLTQTVLPAYEHAIENNEVSGMVNCKINREHIRFGDGNENAILNTTLLLPNYDETSERSISATRYTSIPLIRWTYAQLLGIYLKNLIDGPINILEIGGFPGIFSSTLMGTSDRFVYTGITLAWEPREIGTMVHNLTSNCPNRSHTILESDWKDDSCEQKLQKLGRNFDVLIIDVEPHGQEDKIYSKFSNNLKDKHIVIINCVGCMDNGGSYIANALTGRLGLYNCLYLPCYSFKDFYGYKNKSSDKNHNTKLVGHNLYPDLPDKPPGAGRVRKYSAVESWYNKAIKDFGKEKYGVYVAQQDSLLFIK